MTSDDLHEALRDGRDAAQLLVQIGPFVEDIYRELTSQLFATEPAEAGKRDLLYLEYRALDRVVKKLLARKADGENAEKTLASLNQRGLQQR